MSDTQFTLCYAHEAGDLILEDRYAHVNATTADELLQVSRDNRKPNETLTRILWQTAGSACLWHYKSGWDNRLKAMAFPNKSV